MTTADPVRPLALGAPMPPRSTLHSARRLATRSRPATRPLPGWRAQVEATGGCAAPIHLPGSSRVLDRDGAVLLERSRRRARPVRQPPRDASARPARTATPPTPSTCCAPGSPETTPRTCPTPSPTTRGRSSPSPRPRSGRCTPARVTRARARHPLPLRRAAPPRRPPHRHRRSTPTPTTTTARCSGRPTPARCGPGSPSPCAAPWPPPSASPAREFRDHARLSYAKVAEYQRRGLVHFHAVIRLDGPDGPTDPPPAGLTHDALRAAITTAARAATLTIAPARRDTAGARLGRPARPARGHRRPRRAQIEDDDGEITDAALAGYIAKYATKGTGATEGADRPDPRHRPRRAPRHQRRTTAA